MAHTFVDDNGNEVYVDDDGIVKEHYYVIVKQLGSNDNFGFGRVAESLDEFIGMVEEEARDRGYDTDKLLLEF